uniref:Uncharacterized protein LOC114346298 n=1 Tax=Diabrotica virgifera virgifera TaxID=50390 RepID=A0A6P7GTP3_DIAVI
MKSVFSKLKDKTLKDNMSNIVYSIPCTNCNLQYIGHSSRRLKDRITSHKSDARRYPDRCSLSMHVHENDHQMNYTDAKVLAVENNYFKRLFLEMAFISETDLTINKKSDISHLSEIYSHLLHLDKEFNTNKLHRNTMVSDEYE